MSSFVVNKSHELILQIKNKNLALDATLGNGHDSLFLASSFKKVIGIDIQPLAIKRSKERLKNEPNVDILILYNLGFLPGSDKKVITSYESTLESLEKAYSLINDEGVILIASYIRHSHGYEEYTNIINYLNTHKINYKEYKSEDSFDILIEIKKH